MRAVLPSEAVASSSLENRLAALRAEYLGKLGPRLSAIRFLLERIQKGEAERDAWKEAARLAHGITGSAAVFSLDSLTEPSRALEELCFAAADAAVCPTETSEASAALERLLAAVPSQG